MNNRYYRHLETDELRTYIARKEAEAYCYKLTTLALAIVIVLGLVIAYRASDSLTAGHRIKLDSGYATPDDLRSI